MYKRNLLFIKLKIYFNPRGLNIYSTVCTPEQLDESPSCRGYKILRWCGITNSIFIAALMTNCFFTCGRCRGKWKGVKYKLNYSEGQAISCEYLSSITGLFQISISALLDQCHTVPMSLKMIFSPYCAVSRVCLRLLFCFM